jgi:HAD superfamily hydrolase (TIGR01450 family)
MTQVPETTLEELIELYSVILFDAYGVLANSDLVVPGAAAAIRHLNGLGKPYFVLTNDASALPETRAARYQKLGLSIDPSRIITSGSLLSGYFREHGLERMKCVVLGPADSASYVESAGGVVVSREGDFEAVVIGDQSGYPLLEAGRSVLSGLFRMIDAGRPPRLILPNPDLIYPSGNSFAFASGTVAQMFEGALALRYTDRPELRFTRLGKPHPAIFQEAYRRSSTMDMVMIGDTPDTDIRGANNFGLASALISTGVSTQDVSQLPPEDVPTYLMRSLALDAQ